MIRSRMFVIALTLSGLVLGCEGAGRALVEAPRMAVCAATSLATGASSRSTRSKPTSPPAEPPAPPRVTSDDVERMAKRYEECLYVECLSIAEDLLSRPTARDKYRAKAWFYKGAILMLRSQDDQARECFRQARRLDDHLEADKHRFKPAVIKCFQSAGK